jgi:uncharacterized RDD family membrane protein YckC
MASFSANKPSYSFKKASFLKRLAAFYLSAIFIIFLSYLISYVISELGIFGIELYSKSFWTLFLFVIVIGFATDEIFQSLLTFNLAKLILGLRLVDEREYQSIGFSRSLLRTLFAFLSFVFGGLGFIAILFNREKLSMHDMLVRSSVVDLSENLVSRIVSAIAAFFIAIPGILLSLSFVFVLISSPLFIWSSVKDYQNQKSIVVSEWFDKPNASYSVNLNDDNGSKMITFLITDTGDYHEDFSVQANLTDSTVNINNFDLLGHLKKIKFDLRKFLESRDFLNSFYLKFEKIIFKTTANYDLSIRNPKFYLGYENTISNDLLSTFKYNVIEQENRLSLSLSSNLAMILKNKKLSYLLKSEYIRAVYHIETEWSKFLSELDVNEKSELMGIKNELANNVRIIVDAKNGYIKQYDIIHPGGNTLFNRVTNRFLNSLQFKLMNPIDLSPSDLKNNSFDITLIYRDLV